MTEKRLEEKMDQMIRKEKITYPDNYDEFIQNILEQLPEEPQFQESDKKKKSRKSFHMAWKIAAAALMVLVLAGIPTGAALRSYLKKMEMMNEEKRQEYVEDLENCTADKDHYSRELTEQEKERIKQLMKKYESGECYPAKELLLVENESQIKADQVCFMPDISTYYLPDRSLTDEELLEMIDFRYKRDYCLEKGLEDNEETENGSLEAAQKISKENAIDLSRKWVSDIYGKDVTGWKQSVEIREAVEKENTYYTVSFHKPEEEEEYSASIDAASGECYMLTVSNKKKSDYGKETDISRQKIARLYQNALEIVTEFAPEYRVKKAVCGYAGRKAGKTDKGVVKFMLENEDGQGFLLYYSFHTKKLFAIHKLQDISIWKQTERKSAKKQELNWYQIRLQ